MKITHYRLPCPICSSSDAYHIYEDGHGYCFSCEGFVPSKSMTTDNNSFTFEFIPWRGLTKETMEKYRAATKIDANGNPVAVGFRYPNGAVKIRKIATKEFSSSGDMSNATLFGKDIFSAGSSRSITITEGELDAMSIYQATGYPAVSIRSSSSANKDCHSEIEYLNSFEKVYIATDSDDKGKKAAKVIASLFQTPKVYIVKFSKYKDANDYLQNGESEELKRIWWNAPLYVPDEIVSSYSEIDAIIDKSETKAGVAYPFPTLNTMTFGMRPKEAILFTALEGIGKTEILRAIEFKLLKETDHNIGVLHLEEDDARTIKGWVGYEVQEPVHLPTTRISNTEVKTIYRNITGRDNRVFLSSHFGSDDPDVILGTIRLLVAGYGCKYIFLDHISLVISGLREEDERKQLDYISTQLAMMCQELDFTLVFVSHVNDDGLTRGSRNISKIAHIWVHLSRDKTAEQEVERNTTYLTIQKNRPTGRTGPAGKLFFDPTTYILSEVTNELPV